MGRKKLQGGTTNEAKREHERRLAAIRKKVDEALNDPRRLGETEVDRHFRALKRRRTKG